MATQSLVFLHQTAVHPQVICLANGGCCSVSWLLVRRRLSRTGGQQLSLGREQQCSDALRFSLSLSRCLSLFPAAKRIKERERNRKRDVQKGWGCLVPDWDLEWFLSLPHSPLSSYLPFLSRSILFTFHLPLTHTHTDTHVHARGNCVGSMQYYHSHNILYNHQSCTNCPCMLSHTHGKS